MSTMSNVNNAMSNVKNVICILKEDLSRSPQNRRDLPWSVKIYLIYLIIKWDLSGSVKMSIKLPNHHNIKCHVLSECVYQPSASIVSWFSVFFSFSKVSLFTLIQLKNVSCDELSIFYFWKHIEMQKGISTKLIWSKHIYWSHMIV